MNAFINHFNFQFRVGIRDKQAFMLNYLFPLGFFFMMAFIMVDINPDFLETLIPVMVTFAIIASTLLGIPDPLVKAREDGIYRTYKINGVPALSILIIPALTAMLHLLIVCTIITVTSISLFDAPVPVDWFGFVFTFMAIAAASTGISVLVGVISPSTRMTVLWSQVIFLPSMLLGGLMIPNSLLPEAAGKIAQVLPSTHAMNAFNALGMGSSADFNPWGSVVILVLGGLLAFGLAVYLFSWDSRNAERRGSPLLGLLALLPFLVGIFLS
ncbi:MAG: ABC transporter permease [Chloroflexi bacterium]|nr:ABC transporter permease [Chloroflexota bacterium]